MATLNNSTFREGQSITRPPFFDGNDYAYWKTRMRIYLQALDYEICEVVCDGSFMPMFKNEVGDDIPKPSSQWSALGKTFSNSEKVKKIIRPLAKEWRPKRTAIEEAKNLNILPLDNLIGSLISCEEDLAAEKGDEEKKKSIAVKASKYESDGDSESDDEELAMLARRFRKFFKKTRERRKFKNFKNQREKKEVITCYECKKSSHIRSECPLVNKLNKKAMVATWDDSEEHSSDEEGLQEVSNLALMAIGEDDNLNEGLKKKKNKWYLDSGCSRHMIGNYTWFSSFTKIENGGDVSFGDNSKGKILGIRNAGKVYSTLIENVYLVENLKHNLISISQLCNKGYKVIFDKFSCVIENSCDGKILFVGNRCGNVYIIDIECASTLDKCFSALHDDSWLWHRRPHLNKTPYELWKDRKPNIGYFKVFECKCFILNTKDNLGKFDLKSDVGIFFGYSNSSKAYRVYNKRTLVMEESMHVTFDEFNPSSAEKGVANDDADGELQEESSKENQENAPQENQEDRQEEQINIELEQQESISQTLPKEWRYVSSHPKDVILGDPSRGVTTRSSLRNTCEHNAFISQIEPKSFADAENDKSWILSMQEELNQFERNNVWELVPKPEHQSVIDTKLIFKNKMDESGVVVRNKASLVPKPRRRN
ncbi:Integrase catalytic domain-containing protein [Citrus sinensis]|uniref:Integrase catalytic domain-containing protein n=1 Tax=Citrus sinensis TaxID=2711 RepID=A0ACB8ISV6_CITSI|nr:Integrase catalytic domain-containing protein [Citrus sinensis]